MAIPAIDIHTLERDCRSTGEHVKDSTKELQPVCHLPQGSNFNDCANPCGSGNKQEELKTHTHHPPAKGKDLIVIPEPTTPGCAVQVTLWREEMPQPVDWEAWEGHLGEPHAIQQGQGPAPGIRQCQDTGRAEKGSGAVLRRRTWWGEKVVLEHKKLRRTWQHVLSAQKSLLFLLLAGWHNDALNSLPRYQSWSCPKLL